MRLRSLNSRQLALGLVAIAAIALAFTVSAASVKNFRLYLQASDNGCTNQLGLSQHGDFVNNIGGLGFAPWASDANGYDPDCYRINLNLATLAPVASIIKDFRACLQFADNMSLDKNGDVKGLSQAGTVACTPWASDGGGKSAWAKDGNGYDPDGATLMLETRDLPAGKTAVSDVRLGLQMSDKVCTQQIGTMEFTPWASQGGGWSTNWARDTNGYDPDCGRLALEVRETGDACTEWIACPDAKVLSLKNNAGSPGEGTQYLSAARKPELGGTLTPSIFTIGNNLTYATWMYKIGHNRYGGIITVGDADMRHNGWPSLYGSPDGKSLTFRVGISSDKNQCKGSCKEYYLGQDIPLGVWTHIAVTVSNGKTLTWYLNGSEVKTQPLSSWNTSATPYQNKLYIGNEIVGASEYPNAWFDEIHVWDSALTESQIKANLNKKLIGNEAGLLHYFNFDTGAADITNHAGAFGGVADLKNGASVTADTAANPLKFCTRNICPNLPPPPPPDPTVNGALRIERLVRNQDNTVGSTAAGGTSAGINQTALQSANPAVFLQLSAGARAVYFTDLTGEERFSLCQFNLGGTSCTPPSYNPVPASSCSGGLCTMPAIGVASGKMTAVVVTYAPETPVLPPPPPPPLPPSCSDGIDNDNDQMIDGNDMLDCSPDAPGGPTGERTVTPADTCTLTASPATIVINIGSSKLEWNCTGSSAVITDNNAAFTDIGSQPATGSVNVAPDKTTTFTIASGTANASATVTVTGSVIDETGGL